MEEFLNPGNNLDELSTARDQRKHHKREPIKDLIVSGFDSSEGKQQMGYYTPLHESGRRPTHHLVVMHIHVATPTLIWERESDWETTGQSPVCKIMSIW